MRTAMVFGEVRFPIKARFGACRGNGRMRVGGFPVPDDGSPDFAVFPAAAGLPPALGGDGDRLTGDL